MAAGFVGAVAADGDVGAPCQQRQQLHRFALFRTGRDFLGVALDEPGPELFRTGFGKPCLFVAERNLGAILTYSCMR